MLLLLRLGLVDRLASRQRLCFFWLMRKMTNSAGFTGAMPTSTTSLPSSIDSGGLVSASHFT